MSKQRRGHGGNQPGMSELLAGSIPDDQQVMERSSHGNPIRRTSVESVEDQSGMMASGSYGSGSSDQSFRHPQGETASAGQQARRRPLKQDEFDGPSQLLPMPPADEQEARTQALPDLPVHLNVVEQDEVMRRYNDVMALCAFYFVAKHQFPVPLEKDKGPIRQASDREWTEWAYLLKRLATKRRIPARLLHDNQIKYLVTVLENSVPIRHARSGEPSKIFKIMKDDRYVLQLVSAGIQVAKLLMDSLAMQELIDLYVSTQNIVLERC